MYPCRFPDASHVLLCVDVVFVFLEFFFLLEVFNVYEDFRTLGQWGMMENSRARCRAFLPTSSSWFFAWLA